ncbi:MAG: hypothetical protein V8R91_01390 [Butyricimonas faecihominis]
MFHPCCRFLWIAYPHFIEHYGGTDSHGTLSVALDPFKLGDEVLLACIFGGVVMGTGVGMIMKTRRIKWRN